MKRLQDNREAIAMTAEEADAVMQRIAEISVSMTAEAAQYEEQITTIKSAAAEASKQFNGMLAPLEEQLTAYINAHPERFAKPRMRKTDFGSYGLRSVTKLEITDENAALMSVKAQGIPAYTVIEKLDKKAIEKAISDGKEITGAEVRSGELAKYTVAKALLDQAKNNN